jgi:hypothetical protein
MDLFGVVFTHVEKAPIAAAPRQPQSPKRFSYPKQALGAKAVGGPASRHFGLL